MPAADKQASILLELDPLGALMLTRQFLVEDTEFDQGEGSGTLGRFDNSISASTWDLTAPDQVEYRYFTDTLDRQGVPDPVATEGAFAKILLAAEYNQTATSYSRDAATTPALLQECAFDLYSFSDNAVSGSGGVPTPPIDALVSSVGLIFENPDRQFSFEGDISCGTDTLLSTEKSLQTDGDTRPDGDGTITHTGGGPGSTSDTSPVLDLTGAASSTSTGAFDIGVRLNNFDLFCVSTLSTFDPFN